MNVKRQALITGFVLGVASVPAMAAPWLGPGDPRARSAAQALANQGTGTMVTTWPVTWGEVKQGADQGSAHPYLSFEQQEQAGRSFRGEFSLQGQTRKQPASTDFGPRISADANASLELQWQGSVWAAGVKATYAQKPLDDDESRLDGSYLAAAAGNWVLGVGAIDRWWGPGWRSSLILDNNTRPIEGLWLDRNISQAPDNAVLAWLGPWNFTLVAGQSQQRGGRDDENLAAARFTFRPFTNLELGLSSAVIDQEPVIGQGTGQGTGTGSTDEKREISTLDFRFSPTIASRTIGLYAQALEDHGQNNTADRPWLAGTDWNTSLFNAGQQWFLEFTSDDTYSLGGYHFFNQGANLGAIITRAETGDESASTATLSYGQQALGGWLDLTAEASDKKIQTPDGEQDQWSVGASWRYRF